MKQKAPLGRWIHTTFDFFSRNIFITILVLVASFTFITTETFAAIPGTSVSTNGAASITSTGAVLNGQYTINGLNAPITSNRPSDYSVYFEYDHEQTLAAPGRTDSVELTVLSGAVATPVSGLDPLTTDPALESSKPYYYRLCLVTIYQTTDPAAANAPGYGTQCGQTQNFKTLAASPTDPTTVDNTDEPTDVDNTETPTDVDNTDEPTDVDNTDDSSDVDNTDETPVNQPSLTGADKLQNPLGSVDNIPDLIAKILEIIMKISMPIIVIMLIYSGFLYVKAMGKPEEIKKAHQTLLWTVIGAAVILGAWTLAEAISGTINQLK